MTALPQDVVAELKTRIAELEQRLQASSAENAQLEHAQALSRDRQEASAEILRTIASSPSDAGRSLQQIAETCARLFGAPSVSIQLAENGEWGEAYRFGTSAQHIRSIVPLTRITVGGQNMPGQVITQNKQIDIPDLDHIDPLMAEWPGLPLARAAGTRTMCGTPLRREGRAIGALIIYRDRHLPFTPDELALQQSFADQAAIAIENARLFNETREALDRQIATADILKAIAASPSETGPVFQTIAESTKRLLGGYSVAVFQLIDGNIHLAAYTPTNPAADAALEADFPQPVEMFEAFRFAQSGKPFPIPDTEQVSHAPLRDIARLHGFRSMLWVPVMNGDMPIGVISATRAEPGAFAPHHVQLLQTFADQAVIAIENARLFNEVQAKTRDLEESLQHQTATSEVLQVIGKSMADAQPVFERIADTLARLFEHKQIGIFLAPGDGLLYAGALRGFQMDSVQGVYPLPIEQTAVPAVLEAQQQLYFPDLLHGPNVPASLRKVAQISGNISDVVTPMLWQGRGVGMIAVTREPNAAFTERELSLLRTFADQAVIAIENARLFEEVQAKTHDLEESLQQQTATADVLKVISRSAFDLETVMNTLARSASELCSASLSGLFLREGDLLVMKGHSDVAPELADFLQRSPVTITDRSYMGRAVLYGTTANVADFSADTSSDVRVFQEKLGFSALLMIPLMREGRAIGVFALARKTPGAYSKRQIELVQTFADQAVIAIENARLFDEVQARTRDLAASLEDLRTAQDRLIQTEKLASLGQLTAGIAHEIKNPLNFVNNFAALSAELAYELNGVLASFTLPDKAREEVEELTGLLKDNLQKIVQHGKRADSIVKNMLLHSREGSGEHRPTDINALVEESLNLAYHGARAEKPEFDVTIARDLDPSAGTIEVFPQEITRVLLNLISNGLYAVAKRRSEVAGGFEPMLAASTHSHGDRVEIRIRDNGIGIPPDVMDKMFNPFFTTKPAGEGTGLGLSMSHDIIVKQHGGTIDAETVPGEFTEFTIRLPRKSNFSSKT